MGKNNWTEDQLSAINLRNKNILVSAAAGSGKTAVLVNRIIKLIKEDKVDIDKLLVVTFTNAAASEMRERIGNALEEEIENNPILDLQKQIILLNRSNIETIHSFCLSVIKNNFGKIDIDPDFRIGEETELALIAEEAIEELFEECYEEEDEEFLNLIEAYSSKKNDDGLKTAVMSIYKYAISSPYPQNWLSSIKDDYKTDENFNFSDTKWAKNLVESIQIELKGFKGSMLCSIDLIKDETDFESYLDTLNQDLFNISNLLEESKESFQSLSEGIDKISFSTIGRCKKGADEILKDKVKKNRDSVKKGIGGIREDIGSLSSEIIKKQIDDLYPRVERLIDLTISFMNKYSDKKKEKNLIDFNDIEHFCLEILAENKDGRIIEREAAVKLKEDFYEVLVDEYQDTNNVQETIINLISKENLSHQNLFMVGDVKQSIYRFRQANPEIFLEKYKKYSLNKDQQFVKILLNKNFRSRKEIIDGTNFIFKNIMSSEIGEIDYNQDEMLYLGADYAAKIDTGLMSSGGIELHLIDKGDQQEFTQKEDLEASLIADIIEKLIDSNYGVYDKNIKGLRKISYRDIAVLSRSTVNISGAISDEFKRRDIPAYSDGGSTFFQTLEIKLVCSYLKAIDNPLNDIPVVSILRSPIYRFSSEDLGKIRQYLFKGPFFKALTKASADPDLKDKIDFFLNEFKYFKKLSGIMPLDEFIWHLMTKTAFYGYVGTLPAGVQRQANLRLLFQKAGEFKKTGSNLFRFVNLIDKIVKSSGDYSSAKILGEMDNVVRIMSIHKSKGLEFPIVILAGLGKRFNLSDSTKSILLHKDLGIGTNVVDLERKISYPSLIKSSLSRRIKTENLSEEMRILYVAFTRARERLILTGVVSDIDKNKGKWEDVIFDDNMSKSSVMNANSFLDWIGPCIAHDDGLFETYYHNASEFEASKEGPDDTKTNFLLKDNIKKEIEDKLSYRYPYVLSSQVPSKLSVSEIKSIMLREDNDAKQIFPGNLHKKPIFLQQDSKLIGAERGTAYHAFLEKLNLKVKTDEEIKTEIERIFNNGYITESQRDIIETGKIKTFLSSSLGKRLSSSDKVIREGDFIMQVPAGVIYKELINDPYKDEKVLVQGIIDCFFYEGQDIILIDYKTDKCDKSSKNILADRYKEQLNFYKMAIEKMTNKKVKEKYLYLFSIDETVKVE
ncbi:MAG: helicase-exonuclease AddAB subunit AddA [Clostridiaceae bacterium]